MTERPSADAQLSSTPATTPSSSGPGSVTGRTRWNAPSTCTNTPRSGSEAAVSDSTTIPESVLNLVIDFDRDEAEAVLIALEVRRLSRRGTNARRFAGMRAEAKIAAALREVTGA